MRFLRILFSGATLLLWLAVAGLGQENALVLVKQAGIESNQACSTDLEPDLATIRDYKIGGKGEVRIATGLRELPQSVVSRQAFNRMKKVRLRDLSELEVRDGLMYVSAGVGEEMLAIPNVEPRRNESVSLGQYAAMSLEGVTREGRSRQKQMIPISSVWKMFILTPSMTQEEALFRHAQQEANVGQWTFYLGRVSSYRVREASDGLTQATSGCLDAALGRFRDGEFGAIEEAKELGQRLVAMSGGTGPAAEQLATIRKEEQDVRDRIRSGTQLSREQKWDDALAEWEPLEKYLSDPLLTDFAVAYSETVASSHDSHLQAARAAEQVVGTRGLTFEPGSEEPLRQALHEFEMALNLVPDSEEARQGRREMLIRLALVDARRFRSAEEPGRAYDVLTKLTEEQGQDSRVQVELGEVNCEYGAQLYRQARSVVEATIAPTTKSEAPPGGAGDKEIEVRTVVSQEDKKAFVDARQKLNLAVNLCSSPGLLQSLARVNHELADYHVREARRAMERELFATALLQLRVAQAYQPGHSEVDALLAQALEPARQLARVQAGVVITSVNRQCAEVAKSVAGTVESALVGEATANVQLLGQDQAKEVLQSIRAGSTVQADHNFLILSGQIGVCALNIQRESRKVDSKSVSQNGRFYDYSYREELITTTGEIQLELYADDNILSRTTSVGKAEGTLHETCLARSGVRDSDWSHSTSLTDLLLGGLSGRPRTPVQNVTCPRVDQEAKTLQMAEEVKANARRQAGAALRGIARSYLERAERATDPDIALENYISFALLAAGESGPEFQKALTAIHGRDTDLDPETALQ